MKGREAEGLRNQRWQAALQFSSLFSLQDSVGAEAGLGACWKAKKWPNLLHDLR
jgi:hypothetical protein